MDKFVTAGIWITRRCNLRCKYCNIPKEDIKELKLNKWMRAIDIIKDLGVKRIVLLGGEVTEYKDLIGVVNYILNSVKLECSLTTNGFKNYDKIKDLIKIGMKNIAVSIDTLDVNHSISPLKCKSSLELIKKFEREGLNKKINLKCYTIVSKNNILDLEGLVKHMSKRGIEVYFIPYHWGDEGFFEHRKNLSEFAFITNEDVKLYSVIIDKIIKLKHKNYLINNSEEYLLSSKKHIKDLDWKCKGLSELRIDSDGSLLCCCDRRGQVSKIFSIFDLNNKSKVKKFLEMRAKDSNFCKGCIWPSSFESEKLKYKILNTR